MLVLVHAKNDRVTELNQRFDNPALFIAIACGEAGTRREDSLQQRSMASCFVGSCSKESKRTRTAVVGHLDHLQHLAHGRVKELVARFEAICFRGPIRHSAGCIMG